MRSVINVQNILTKFSPFRQTHNNNRITLCSWVCAFVFDLDLLYQLVMLGPKQRYHEKHSPEMVWKQSAKDHGANYWGAQYRSVTVGRISVIHVFSPILAIIMLKFTIVSNKTNLTYPNCWFFTREWLNCLSNSASLRRKLARSQPSWRLEVTDHGQLTLHPEDRCV